MVTFNFPGSNARFAEALTPTLRPRRLSALGALSGIADHRPDESGGLATALRCRGDLTSRLHVGAILVLIRSVAALRAAP